MAGRPTVVLVAQAVHDAGGMERALAELVRRGSDRYRFVVVSAELAPDLRPLVDWRRVAVPLRPMPLKLALLAVLGSLAVRRTAAELVHVTGAIVLNGADVATIQFCHAGLVERTGSWAPAGTSRLRRLNTAATRLVSIGLERWCFRPSRLRLFAAVSHGIEAELERHYPGIPVVVAPNGVDTGRFRPDAAGRPALRDELSTPAGAVVAVFVGGDWDRKGLGIAVEALARAADVHLWVVGPGDEAGARELARRLGVEARVRFAGRRADTERYYQAADVFVFPTAYEAFPLVALEAAASGLPIVAPPVNGIEELLAGGEAGILVERSPAAVGAALQRLAQDRALRELLGSQARARAAAYTWERSSETVLAAYADLLAGPGANGRAA